MKKILSILGAIGLTATGITTTGFSLNIKEIQKENKTMEFISSSNLGWETTMPEIDKNSNLVVMVKKDGNLLGGVIKSNLNNESFFINDIKIGFDYKQKRITTLNSSNVIVNTVKEFYKIPK